MIKEIEKIEIDRAEGKPHECGVKIVKTIEQADHIIKEMHWTGPAPGEGYHKVYVKVIFKDGSSIRDRIDIDNHSFPRSVQEITEAHEICEMCGRRHPTPPSELPWCADWNDSPVADCPDSSEIIRFWIKRGEELGYTWIANEMKFIKKIKPGDEQKNWKSKCPWCGGEVIFSKDKVTCEKCQTEWKREDWRW